MFSVLAEIGPYLSFLAPPLIGALIGYLTNRVAIRMLFRPLRRWRIGGFPIPMTPGVLPAKRHEFAENIGTMVGEHLLTGEEINRALRTERFQEHLLAMIEAKIGSYLKYDLGSLHSLVPPAYRSYFDIGSKTFVYRLKERAHATIVSDEFNMVLEPLLDQWLEHLRGRPLDELIDSRGRRRAAASIAARVSAAVAAPAGLTRLEGYIGARFEALAGDPRTLGEIVPPTARIAIADTVAAQSPYLLEKAAEMLTDPEVTEMLVETLLDTIDEFLDTLGPLSSMARNVLDKQAVAEKLRDFLRRKEGGIELFLLDEPLVVRLAAALRQRTTQLFETPLAELFGRVGPQRRKQLAQECAGMVHDWSRSGALAALFEELLDEAIGGREEDEPGTVGAALEGLLGNEATVRLERQLKTEAAGLLRSRQGRAVLDAIIDSTVETVMHQPIGKLGHLVPAGVKTGVCRSVRDVTTRMLVAEVPGIVRSIDISRIIAEKIDSFDLLQLEQLLLSIMAEHFRYINLFGALLGFLIGCANLIFIVGSG